MSFADLVTFTYLIRTLIPYVMKNYVWIITHMERLVNILEMVGRQDIYISKLTIETELQFYVHQKNRTIKTNFT